jgi:hypothetical protein
MYSNPIQERFPLAEHYPCPSRGRRPAAIRERRAARPDFLYTERHLQCLWFDGALRPEPLVSSDGEGLTVDAPGNWNLEAGPDFCDAVLRVGAEQRRVQGDVEIHVRPEDWTRHAHAADPRYRRVIAHVTYFPPGARAPDLPPHVLQIALAPALAACPTFSFESIDLTAYPFAEPRQQPTPCAQRLARLPVDAVAALLDCAGQQRLRRKAERLHLRLRAQPPDDVFYEETMAALGYKQNVTAFRTLAQRVTRQHLQTCQSPLDAYSLLLGVSGLLPTQARADWPAEARAFVRTLWDRWWPIQDAWLDRTMVARDWALAGLRPQNAPRRRLAAAAAHFQPAGSLWERLRAVPRADPAVWYRGLLAQLTDCDHIPFLASHLALSSKPANKPLRNLGDMRAAAIMLNVVVPLLAAEGVQVEPLLAELPPEQNNLAIRRGAHLLLGCDHNPALYHRHGLRQQGLIQIFEDFCLSNHAVCTACRFCDALDEYLASHP